MKNSKSIEEKSKEALYSLLFSNGHYKNITMYLDETNNTVKYQIKHNKFNIHLNDNHEEFFIIAGIFKEDTKNTDFKEIDKVLPENDKLEEYKYKSFLGKNKNKKFLDMMGSSPVQKLLNWMNDNNYLLYYSITDVIYFSIVDIIDPIVMYIHELFSDYFFFNTETIENNKLDHRLKTIFCNYAKNHYNDFLAFSKIVDVHSLKDNQKKSYIFIINKMIGESIKNNYYQETKFLISVKFDMISGQFFNDENVRKHINIFLDDPKSNKLVDNYLSMYNLNPSLLIDSNIFIDNNDFVKNNLYIEKNNNVKFLDSKKYKPLQVSDILCNILKHFFAWLANTSYEDIRNISEEHIDNIKPFIKLLENSRQYDEFYRTICCSFDIESKLTFLRKEVL